MTITLCILGWIAGAIGTAWLDYFCNKERCTNDDAYGLLLLWPLALVAIMVKALPRLFP